jgi:hypothetical protein
MSLLETQLTFRTRHPEQYKLSFERLECSEIRLANNETIKVSGVENIELNIKSQGTHFIDVYILPVTSHPLILEHSLALEPTQ